MTKFTQIVLFVALSSTMVQGTSRFRQVNAPGLPKLQLPEGGSISVRTDKVEGAPKRELMGMIDAFRAEICYQLKDEHGTRFKSFAACKEFMEEACNPGKDMTMDKDPSEITSRKGYCKEYFNNKKAEKELKKQVGDKEAEELINHALPAPAPAPAPSPAAQPAPAPATEAVTEAPAPAPAPVVKEEAPAPAPAEKAAEAPAPAPASEEGKKEGKKEGKEEDDTAWYSKEGGKWSGRMHMDADLKLPTQGYWGKLVEHEDQETVTGDWGHEFGTKQYDVKTHYETFDKICLKYPDNAWCLEHHPHGGRHSSGYRASLQIFATLLAPLLLWGVNMA